MPRFSVIVPAHQAHAYVPECLESVLTQSFTDLELIAVDDGSPDACGGLLTDAAAADRRVTVLRLAEPTGPGPARNAGLAHARGDYVLFLDSDDALSPGALQAIADRLLDTAEPDLLLFDHERAFWHGGTDRGAPAGLLAHREPQVFRAGDRPELLRLPGVAWNKACRRAFLTRHGLRFPPGAYEGVAFSWSVLLAAEAVTVLDRVCVQHRRRRSGGLLAQAPRKHFDLFAQYDRVFAFLDRQPGLHPWRPVLYRRMTDHLTAVFLAPGRLPRAGRAEFFRRSGRLCARHRAAADRTTARYLLLRLGARRTFRLLWAAGGLRRRLRAACRAVHGAAVRAAYRVHCRRRLDPALAVFAAPGEGGYTGDPAAVEAAARRLIPGLRTAWVGTEAQAAGLPRAVRRLQPGSAAHWRALARATYLVSSGDFEAGLRKRPGQVLVQTHRGSPLGREGLDLGDHPVAGLRVDCAALLARVDDWDYSLSANRHSTLARERAYPGRYTTLEYGAPRNDVLYRATAEDVARVRTELGVPAGAVAVLYAPAPRDHLRGRPPRLDVTRLAHALGHGFVVLDGTAPHGVHRSAARLCLAADALVTDYAPLVFDYANLDRPIVLHADDWETFRATRGTYLDLPGTPPGPVAWDVAGLVRLFHSGAWCGPRSTALRSAFRARFCPYDDGHAAERVARAVFLDGVGLAPVVPPAHRRPAPLPSVAAPRGRVVRPGGPPTAARTTG
ncbi:MULTISPECIES: bifunctional glycosyltransferase/CDP-glycerol:glycerophosphate glycerophosphotransferase [Streptomyces]|uniref:bifunctional glycosyltransferase/CDP-glycerol:glycerophosphate glycerophosphotransferase n=1 Tax=Streptomyces TaxID=1883 RepID=UPI0022489835|nr:bifunctional glycosyltransferase family 2 protein/CDP-glycerol:glycerophosphate glycerophosphotransferase [Streptomyces sp. JHD 1]MCX2970823.1 bifunctional glycosyltransferase family 2 protein/CDP-glycerol:glycerophosphate glycerophosphotransferase [Streptomyces sp. JHD 1]